MGEHRSRLFGKFVFSHWSLYWILGIGYVVVKLMMTMNAPHYPRLHDLSLSVFSVLGTMAALILPAAGIFAQHFARTGDFWAGRAAGKEGAGFAEGSKIVGRAELKLNEAQLASFYVLVGFLLSIASLLVPRLRLDDGRRCLLDYALTGGALALLVIGSALFISLALWVFDAKIVSALRGVLELRDAEGTRAATDAPEVGADPVSGGLDGANPSDSEG